MMRGYTQNNGRSLSRIRTFTRNHLGILNSLPLTLIWNASLGGGWFDLFWFDLIWFDLIWFDLFWFDLWLSPISWMPAVVLVAGWVRWVFSEWWCLSCQAVHLCPCHIKVKRSSLRSTHGPRGNSAQKRKVPASVPRGAKAAKLPHLEQRAYRSCPFLGFWGTSRNAVKQGHREGVGGVCTGHSRLSHEKSKFIFMWIFPFSLTFQFSCRRKALKSSEHPGEGSGALGHRLLESQGRCGNSDVDCSSHVISSIN